ncbi:SURF1 family protein [Pseudoxanthomonas sp. z9]|uniref:SURF1 family protein n=1 Tax=Pseudoxanthomonas sp. z9 TaxID=2584942 RepID=UPI001141C419|nr:SURF1 family protein [Pseudoxanthomonas sp. z9]
MPLAVGWTLALVVIALFCGLGTWQLGRAKQKEAMLAASHRILAERKPVPLAQAGQPGREAEYAWTAGHGRFLPGPAVLLDNQNHGGRAGIRAYRVFQAEDAPPVLVELGWLPLPGDRTLPAIALPQGEQALGGLLAPPPSAGLVKAVGTRQPDGNLLVTALDLRTLARDLALPTLAPRVFRPDPALPLGYARDLDILPNTLPPERHLGYAVQWFGLALAVLITALVVSRRGRRRQQER